MNTETPKDQTGRIRQIALLEAVIARHAASIAICELGLRRQIANQLNRLAELRCQQLLLEIAGHPGRRRQP